MSMANATLAFDRKSARSFDADGRMRVRGCVLSVAEINPYRGREIPGWQELGLDANKVYDLYRDPAELKAGADSFNGLPLFIKHIAQTAKNPRKEYMGGSVYNATFDDSTEQLRADLLVMDEQAIAYVETGELADLSNGYRYKPDMTPGEINGRRYDGVMRAIEGNHVALVEDGRATGAHVADSALSSLNGAHNVTDIAPSAAPAAPAAGADVAAMLMTITSKLEGIETRLTAVEGGKVDTPQSEAESGIPASVNTANDEQSDKDREDESKGEKRSEKDRKDESEGEKRAEDSNIALDANTVRQMMADAVTAERNRAAGVEAAKRATRADLGDAIALDSEADIYRAALKQRGVTELPEGADLKATYMAIKSATAPQRTVLATDSAGGGKPAFDTSRIRNLGRA